MPSGLWDYNTVMSLQSLILIRAGSMISLISRKGTPLPTPTPKYLPGDIITLAAPIDLPSPVITTSDLIYDLAGWSFRIGQCEYVCLPQAAIEITTHRERNSNDTLQA